MKEKHKNVIDSEHDGALLVFHQEGERFGIIVVCMSMHIHAHTRTHAKHLPFQVLGLSHPSSYFFPVPMGFLLPGKQS